MTESHELSRYLPSQIDAHEDLYQRSHEHRQAHGAGCNVYPSPQAPLWAVIALALRAERVLEIGCGLGYTAVCLADSLPNVVVHTIEQDPTHADLAEQEFRRLGLDQRITVLRGRAEEILAGLEEPYDVVLEDAGIDYDEWLPHLTRLTAPGGMLVTTNLSSYLPAWKDSLPREAMTLVRPAVGS